MITKITSHVALFILHILSLNVIGAQDNKSISNDLDVFFSAQRAKYNLVAISAGIVKEKSMVWSGAYGLKNMETKEIVSPNTLFHQGSISKTITLAAFLQLCEREKIDLDYDINRYLPFDVKNPNHPDVPITFRMLLTHTSGINDVNVSKRKNKISMLNKNQDNPKQLGSTMKNILNKEGDYYSEDYFLAGKPGTEYSYSNLAYSLIGYLVEEISGQSFIDYCRKNIFDPLKMKKSTFLLSKTDTTNFAYQYYYNRENPDELIKVKPYTWAGYMDGSLRTNIPEYSNFLIMLINKGKFEGVEVLSENTIEIMLSIQDLPGKQSTRLFEPAGRAILWNKVKVKVEGKDIEIYHFNGFGSGFFTDVFFNVDKKFAGIFFTTGQFKSFPMMGRALKESIVELLKVQNTINNM